jgi:hypothetical protein
VIFHNRDEALREVRNMPEKNFQDGLLLDVPKRRRREQAMGNGQLRISWPRDQKKRFAKQYNRYVEIFTKDIGIEALLCRLEVPSDEELRKEAEGD